MAKRIVILGGGIGGVAALRTLEHGLKVHKADVEITVITKSRRHYMPPMFFDVAIGEVSPEETFVDTENIRRLGARIVYGEAIRVDAANRRVFLADGSSVEYDYLVVALGSKYDWRRYPGLEEAGYHNYTLDGALGLREALARFRGGDVVVLVPEIPYRCGIYPYEAATVFAAMFQRRGIKANVKVVAPSPKPVARLGRDISSFVSRVMEELGVEYVRHKGLEEVDVEKRLVRAGNVEEKYDLLVKVPPPGLPDVLASSEGFTFRDDPRFAPARGRDFRHPEYDDVYMVGEHSLPPLGLSMAGAFVHNAAFLAMGNLLADLVGVEPPFRMPAVTCAGYAGFKGFLGHCEPKYVEEKDVYDMKGRCYLGPALGLIRLVKLGYYKSWLSALA